MTAVPDVNASLRRAMRVGLQTWDAPPERVLPLLSPKGEEAWAVGWKADIRWQAPGNGQGTLFVTRTHHQDEALWVLQTWDAPRAVAYSYLVPGILLVELTILLAPLAAGQTQGEVRYTSPRSPSPATPACWR